MAVAKELYEREIKPCQYVLELLEQNKKHIPDFYRSDLQEEFNTVWKFQQQFYESILTLDLYDELKGKNKGATWKICETPFEIEGVKIEGKTAKEKKKNIYKYRVKALSQKVNLEELAIVLQEINNDLNKSSGYLGAISDRSKELFFDKITVGEYLYNQIKKDRHTSLKNQVFYRQDYLDEFETIWETQAKFHIELTEELKKEVRDVIIFYQRKLKSQKGLISLCQFEQGKQVYFDKVANKEKTRVIGQRVIPKSSPLFQEYKIWQNLNNLEFKNEKLNEKIEFIKLDNEVRNEIFEELNLRGDLKPKDVLNVLNKYLELGKISDWKCNFEKIEGNRTNQSLFNVYKAIVENEGHGFDWDKKKAIEIKEELKAVFELIGIDNSILDFDTMLSGNKLEKQSSFLLWHLLYSAEDENKIKAEDKLVYGNTNVGIKKVLHLKYGFKPEYATLIAGIDFINDYGSLSSKAIRKILPHLEDGNDYYEACALAGYNHSNSLTKEELDKRFLKDKLDLLPKNSLRNPVVEKILNQMVNVINQVSEEYGKPDEIRIELARDLKKSAKQREKSVKLINENTRANDKVREIIKKDFGFTATKNDVIRYKLYQELKNNGYKTLFTNKKIDYRTELFSKNIDIEHIIPKAILFDDSFSNKTLAFRDVNLKKNARTAIDFIEGDYNNDLENYKSRVENLFKLGAITKGKYKKLLMSLENLPTDFIARDLVNTQYISKKAKDMLLEVFPTVVSTSGRITDRLRADWDLINVMKELSISKYRALGLTEVQTRKGGKEVEVIVDWTKRNDHRHHAMDALTVAFTTHNHIQYINNMSARKDNEFKVGIAKIKNTIKHKVNGKSIFIAPMPNFRQEAKNKIEEILISIKAKNKVVTKNINKTKLIGKDNYKKTEQLTPRGQLHKETVYGKSKRELSKKTKISKRFTLDDANFIINKEQREIVLKHLKEYSNNPLVAFDTKTIKKSPILYKGEPLKEVFCFEEIYTIRKDINPDNFKNKKSLEKIIDKKIKIALENRLNEYGDNPKEAFSNLEENPIWLNKKEGISIKRVKITGVSNVEALHYKKDRFGNEILDSAGNKQAVDFVSTGNNHHVAIYEDSKGKLQERVVSFYEAVARVNAELPIVDNLYKKDEGWKFQFTMKQNEMFLFPSANFNPLEVDLLKVKDLKILSENLYRVQKISTKNYMFTHHLETEATTGDDLKNKKCYLRKNIIR